MEPSDSTTKSIIETAARHRANNGAQLVIQPSRGWSSLGLHEVWEYRELLLFLVYRETQGIYRQTALGITWIFLRPIISMVLLTLVFSQVVRVPSDGLPYPLFSLAALIPWGFFSNAVTRSSRSLVDNMHVISKVYFPRMVLPVAATLSGLIDMGASFLVFLVAVPLYRMALRMEMLLLPAFVFLTVGFALATGLWLATLSVKYRDVSFAVTFLLQALMYLSPVIYPLSIVPRSLKPFYFLNPMAVVIQGFRWASLGGDAPDASSLVVSSIVVLAGLVSGAYVFRRTERTVVDVL